MQPTQTLNLLNIKTVEDIILNFDLISYYLYDVAETKLRRFSGCPSFRIQLEQAIKILKEQLEKEENKDFKLNLMSSRDFKGMFNKLVSRVGNNYVNLLNHKYKNNIVVVGNTLKSEVEIKEENSDPLDFLIKEQEDNIAQKAKNIELLSYKEDLTKVIKIDKRGQSYFDF